jgi:hypothetical protein
VLCGLIAFAFARKPIERIGARAASAPVRAGLIGLLAEILFLPVVILLVVVLAVSIVGIPLLALVPFAILLVMLVMFVGFIALAGEVGRWLIARSGWAARGDHAAIVLGILSVTGLTLVAKLAAIGGSAALGWPLGVLGYSVEYLVWTIGFGATILSFSEARRWSRPTGPATSAEPGTSPAAV